ncbi:hypothetical protein LTR84_007627 [Exophiala bonariae]|uniref:Major facilitator superfamily (MFS) profile domain-containing protein n=1 Tax=Exophiala bonariae TaxID=1690606 RepID=A0AAV9NPF6_9EURO|nr:hypothetical protein LTR84_007627 [Exophiala bonariae]
MVHTETIEGVPQDNGGSYNEVQDYESRSIDLRTILGLLALGVTYEACVFSLTLPAAILLTINEGVGPSNNIAWAVTSWALASAVVMTIAGRCGDIFGRKNFFLVGNLLGAVGCAIASRATTASLIILGGAFLGLSAGLQQLAFAAASEIVPKKNRGQSFAFMSLVSIPGSSFGGPIANQLVAQGSWKWAYYVCLIVNVVAFILILVFYWPPDFLGLHPDGKTRRQQFFELDFVGLLLFGGGLTVFLVGIGFGGNPYPWTSAVVLAPTIIGGLFVFVAFPLWEVYGPNNIAKLCPPRIWQDIRAVVVPLVVSFTGGMALITQLLKAGVILGVNATSNEHTPARAIVLVGLASLMIGATNCMSILIVQLGARDEDIGLATGLVNSVRATGGAIGVAIYSSLLTNRVSSTWAKDIGRALTQAGLPAASLTPFLSLAIIAALFVADVDKRLTKQVNIQLARPHLGGSGNSKAKVLHEPEDQCNRH